MCLEKKKNTPLFFFFLLINFMAKAAEFAAFAFCLTTLTSVRSGNLTLCYGLVHMERHIHKHAHTRTPSAEDSRGKV